MANINQPGQVATSRINRAFERINWLQRELPDPQDQREYAQERCIVAVTEALGEAMEKAGLSRADLAERLGVSKSHITQLFGGRNLTLRTIGDVLWACELEVRDLELGALGVAEVPIDQAAEWRSAIEPAMAAGVKGAFEVSLDPSSYSPHRIGEGDTIVNYTLTAPLTISESAGPETPPFGVANDNLALAA